MRRGWVRWMSKVNNKQTNKETRMTEESFEGSDGKEVVGRGLKRVVWSICVHSKQPYICEHPDKIECQAWDPQLKRFVSSKRRKSTLKCRSRHFIKCLDSDDTDCTKFRVRFKCPRGRTREMKFTVCVCWMVAWVCGWLVERC